MSYHTNSESNDQSTELDFYGAYRLAVHQFLSIPLSERRIDQNSCDLPCFITPENVRRLHFSGSVIETEDLFGFALFLAQFMTPAMAVYVEQESSGRHDQ